MSKKKKGKKRTPSIEDSLDATIPALIAAVFNNNVDIKTNRKTIKIKIKKWEEKQQYGYFIVKKEKPKERNWMYFNNSIKQCYKEQLYQSENW